MVKTVMIRSYIHTGAMTNPPSPLSLMKQVREAGAENPRLCRYNGWTNQPHVLTFTANEEVQKAVQDTLPMGLTVRQKDW